MSIVVVANGSLRHTFTHYKKQRMLQLGVKECMVLLLIRDVYPPIMLFIAVAFRCVLRSGVAGGGGGAGGMALQFRKSVG